MSEHLMKAALGLALREAREAADVRQSAIARELGIDKGTVSEWERGQGGHPPDSAVDVYARLAGQTYISIYERAVAILAEDAKRRGPRT